MAGVGRPVARRRALRARHPHRGRAAPARQPRGQAGARARVRRRADLGRHGQAGRQGHRRRRVGRAGRPRPPAVRARRGEGRAPPGRPRRPRLRPGRHHRCRAERLRPRQRRRPRPRLPPGAPRAPARGAVRHLAPPPRVPGRDRWHPAARIRRPYFDRTPIGGERRAAGTDTRHDRRPVHEPQPGELPGRHRARARADGRASRSRYWNEAMRWVPATLIVRARKQGI